MAPAKSVERESLTFRDRFGPCLRRRLCQSWKHLPVLFHYGSGFSFPLCFEGLERIVRGLFLGPVHICRCVLNVPGLEQEPRPQIPSCF